MSSLSLSGITKRYAKETVLDQVNLSVDSGETLVLFGPSGAGKTVLLRLLAGVIDPDAGSVFIDGEDMTGVEAEHRGIGMAFQNFALFPHMSAFDNIASPLTATGTDSDGIKAGVHQVARLLRIEHVLDHAPRELSNGQKQRTALARALVGEPPVLLLDDPLRNVDAKLRFEMRLELPRLLRGRGATVIYVTQDYKEAMALGDRIAVLNAGTVEQMGTPEDIYLTPANLEIARLFGDPVINLYDVTVNATDHRCSVELSGVDIPLDNANLLKDGQTCVLGIRPENISFVVEGAGASAGQVLPVEVEAETPLNEKVVTLAVTAGGREVLVSRPSGTPGPATGNALITIRPGSIMLFDKSSGRRIDLSPDDGGPVSAAGKSVSGQGAHA